MFWLIQKAFLALLSSRKSWATKSVSLNNESCLTESTLIDLNHFGLNCYPFLKYAIEYVMTLITNLGKYIFQVR